MKIAHHVTYMQWLSYVSSKVTADNILKYKISNTEFLVLFPSNFDLLIIVFIFSKENPNKPAKILHGVFLVGDIIFYVGQLESDSDWLKNKYFCLINLT